MPAAMRDQRREQREGDRRAVRIAGRIPIEEADRRDRRRRGEPLHLRALDPRSSVDSAARSPPQHATNSTIVGHASESSSAVAVPGRQEWSGCATPGKFTWNSRVTPSAEVSEREYTPRRDREPDQDAPARATTERPVGNSCRIKIERRGIARATPGRTPRPTRRPARPCCDRCVRVRLRRAMPSGSLSPMKMNRDPSDGAARSAYPQQGADGRARERERSPDQRIG